MSEKSRAIAAFVLIFAVLAAFFFVPVRRTTVNEFSGSDGSRQRVRTFEKINISLGEYFRTRGVRPGDSAGDETTTVLRAGIYAVRIGGILLGGAALVGVSALISRRKKKN